ncbi:hypothetical protein [Caldisphaera sp.]|nr:hypothetical protein [Caldisphaera sp.]
MKDSFYEVLHIRGIEDHALLYTENTLLINRWFNSLKIIRKAPTTLNN